MKRNVLILAAVATGLIAGVFSAPVQADSLSWDAFVIRNASSGGDVPPITENIDGDGVTTSITEGGQKTGFGTTGVDGLKVGDLVSLSYDRIDSGSGTPYVNIWITDGTNYALIAPVVGAKTDGGYVTEDVNGLSLQTLGFNIYDNSDGSDYDWLFSGAKIDAGPDSLLQSDGDIITLSQIANLTIVAAPPTPSSDSGAPQNGDGFNIIFGDTQGDFTSPIPYDIDHVTLTTTVPLPASAWSGLALLGGLGLLGGVKRLRRQMA